MYLKIVKDITAFKLARLLNTTKSLSLYFKKNLGPFQQGPLLKWAPRPVCPGAGGVF